MRERVVRWESQRTVELNPSVISYVSRNRPLCKPISYRYYSNTSQIQGTDTGPEPALGHPKFRIEGSATRPIAIPASAHLCGHSGDNNSALRFRNRSQGLKARLGQG